MPHGPNSRRKPLPMTADELMAAEQAATLKRLAQAAYELDAFKPNLTRTEADNSPHIHGTHVPVEEPSTAS